MYEKTLNRIKNEIKSNIYLSLKLSSINIESNIICFPDQELSLFLKIFPTKIKCDSFKIWLYSNLT